MIKFDEKSVVVVGLGKMGKGIVAQMTMEEVRNPLDINIRIYDERADEEDVCLLKCESAVGAEKAHSIVSKLRAIDDDPFRAIRTAKPNLIINAATFHGQFAYSKIAIEVGCDYVDLGQRTLTALTHRVYDTMIRKRKTFSRIVPESGLAPGLVNIIASALHRSSLRGNRNGRVFELQIRCCGLPQNTEKGGSLHYGSSWSTEGLLEEYKSETFAISHKQFIATKTFMHPEYWEESDHCFGTKPFKVASHKISTLLKDRVQPQLMNYGNDNCLYLKGLEARPTSDGTSTMCFDLKYLNSVENLEYKTLRFAPHFEEFSKLIAEGRINTLTLEPAEPDMVLIRVWAKRRVKADVSSVEMIVLHDETSYPGAFSAMQHCTGWPTVLLARTLLEYSTDNSFSRRPSLLRAPNEKASSGRTVEEVLREGGVIMPYELLCGKTLLEMLDTDARIPLREIRQPSRW